MPDSAVHSRGTGSQKRPNFYAVILGGAIILLLFFLGAWLLVMHSGKHMLPNNHPDPHPHAMLRMPGSRIDA